MQERPMKFQLPKAPQTPPPEVPKNTFGKLLTSTPVIMTVVSTLMAGLSQSEMTRGQYDRSTAAQIQAKVGDQWSFYQARRLRSASIRGSEIILTSTSDTSRLKPEVLRQALASIPGEQPPSDVLETLVKGTLPGDWPKTRPSPLIQSALDGIASGKSDRELSPLLARISPDEVAITLEAAQTNSAALDRAMGELSEGLNQWERGLERQLTMSPETVRPLWRDFAAARMHLDALRLDAEAKLSRPVADLLELQVRQSNRDAERHRVRSGRFFIGMLASQLAVVMATFALAVQRRNTIWAVAASLGLAAIGFGVYVYLHD
jgi:hypothetical protein